MIQYYPDFASSARPSSLSLYHSSGEGSFFGVGRRPKSLAPLIIEVSSTGLTITEPSLSSETDLTSILSVGPFACNQLYRNNPFLPFGTRLSPYVPVFQQEGSFLMTNLGLPLLKRRHVLVPSLSEITDVQCVILDGCNATSFF